MSEKSYFRDHYNNTRHRFFTAPSLGTLGQWLVASSNMQLEPADQAELYREALNYFQRGPAVRE